MMKTVAFYAVKGGQGTTTVACAVAMQAAGVGHRVAMVSGRPFNDLYGVFGMARGGGDMVEVPVRGGQVDVFDEWVRVSDVGVLRRYSLLILDCDAETVPASVEHRVLVTTSCFMALRHAVDERPTGFVYLDEPHRALGIRDVQSVPPFQAVPLLATIPILPGIARGVDAGLLVSRLPRALQTAADAIVRATCPAPVGVA
jgi:hypothetical protein